MQRTGANIWDEELEGGSINITNGENTPNGTTTRSKNYISVIPGTSYYMLLPWAYIFWYDINKNYIKYVGNGVTEDGAVHGKTIVAPNNAYYMRFRCSGTYGTAYNHDISINYPSTDHDYHAYTGNSYNISWETEAGTVYGGTLDVVSGVLTVDKASVDLGTLTWNYRTNFAFFISKIADAKYYNRIKGGNCICSMYASAYNATISGWSGFPDKTVACGNNYSTTDGINVTLKDTTYTNAVTFKAAMSGVQLVYELAEPITYHLTPTEVRTLLGQNNVWADTGNSTVEYCADTKRYIDKRISELVNS